MSVPRQPSHPIPLPSREEALYQLYFESTPQAALIFDLAGDGEPARIRACNEAAVRLLGYAEPELRARTLLDLTEGENRRALAQSLVDLRTVEAGTWEVTLRTATNKPVELTLDGMLFEDAGQRSTMVLLSDRHLPTASGSRPAPRDLPALFSRRAISFLESRPGDDIYPLIAAGLGELVGNASVVLTSCDERAGILTVRETIGPIRHWIRFARTIGLNPSRVALPTSGFYRDNLVLGTLVHAEEGLYDMCLGAVPRVVCRGAEKVFGIGHVYAMGIVRRGVLHGTVVVLNRGDKPLENPDVVEAYVNLAAVALHRQQAMDELAESQSKLLRIERLEAMGRLASGLAHDFNNLLTLILGNSDLVHRSLPEADPRRRPVEKIISAARRAAALTTQLLAFSRRDPNAPTRVVLDPILTELEPMLQGLAGERRRLVLRLLSGPGDNHVLIHPSQVEQIAMNLVSNACDAIPDGGEVVVQTQSVALSEPLSAATGLIPAGQFITLSVSDTGMGMAPDTEAQIFEPFFTTKPKQKGTGLGLSTVYGIVEQCQGHIRIDTAPQQGTRVTVYLPHNTTPAHELTTGRPAAASSIAHNEATATPSEGITVLLVEDQELVRDVASMMLRELGYRVLVAAGGEEALDMAAAHDGPLDLLVTDVVMPGLEGTELAEQLTGQRAETRVLFISGCTDGSIIHADRMTTPAAFLPKPFTRDELQAALETLLQDS
jgi:PAS domain S-box-containing protein